MSLVGDSGDVIGKLTEGQLEQCKGIEIDDDGDISNQKNQRIGHVTRIQDIPSDEKTEEELEAERKAAEEEEAKKLEDEEKAKDAKLVQQMIVKVEDGLEKVKPMLKEMTNASASKTSGSSVGADILTENQQRRSHTQGRA